MEPARRDLPGVDVVRLTLVLATSLTLVATAAHGTPAQSSCQARDGEGWVREVDCDTGEPSESSAMPLSPVPQQGDTAQPTAQDGHPDGAAAAADECDISCLPCVVVPHPGCGTQPHLELGMGWGESHSYVGWQWSFRGWVEAGMLIGVHRNLQLGPVFELGFDTGRVNSGYTASSKLKSRYWMAGWYVALDGAVGAAFEHFTFDGGTENGTRYGLTVDHAVTVLGSLGPYVSYSALTAPTGEAGWEHRILVGFRASLGGWAVLLYPFAAALSSGPILAF